MRIASFARQRLALLFLALVSLAACPQRVSTIAPAPAEHGIDSNDPVDPADLYPPNTRQRNPAQGDDGCPDVDAARMRVEARRGAPCPDRGTLTGWKGESA